jgi:DNA-binding IclR family transcriptional regulator
MDLPAEPTPAAVRVIDVIRCLGEFGPQQRDAIARCTGIPRSTCLRLLAALRASRVTEHDSHDGFWRLRERLTPITDDSDDLLAAGATVFEELCARGTFTAEVYALVDRRLRLVRKQEAVAAVLSTRVQPGWVHDVRQADARTLILVGWGLVEPRAPLQTIMGVDGPTWSVDEIQQGGAVARRRRFACDLGFNSHGILRQAVPLLDNGVLRGVLAGAQFLTPGLDGSDASLARRLRRAGRSWFQGQ